MLGVTVPLTCLECPPTLLVLLLVQLVGRFWVLFLSYTAPEFQLWFCLHLCMWVIHWDLLLRLALEDLGLPPLSARCGGGAASWVTGPLAVPGIQRSWHLGQQEMKYSALEGYGNPLQYSCLEKPPLTEKPGRPQSTGSQRVGNN